MVSLRFAYFKLSPQIEELLTSEWSQDSNNANVIEFAKEIAGKSLNGEKSQKHEAQVTKLIDYEPIREHAW